MWRSSKGHAMRTLKRHRTMRPCAACVMIMSITLLLSAGAAVAQRPPAGKETITLGSASLTDAAISRDNPLEERVAARLKAERFNRSSRILILDTSNRADL